MTYKISNGDFDEAWRISKQKDLLLRQEIQDLKTQADELRRFIHSHGLVGEWFEWLEEYRLKTGNNNNSNNSNNSNNQRGQSK